MSEIQPTRRDRQRELLNELVTLATECAQREAAIERDHQLAVAETEKKGQWARSELERQLEQVRGDIGRRYDERLKELEGAFAKESSALSAGAREEKTRAEQVWEAATAEAKDKINKAVWLADSVLEGTQAQIRGLLKEAREKHEQQMEAVDQRQNQALNLLGRYGIVAEPAGAPEVPKDAPAPGVDEAAEQEAAAGVESAMGVVDEKLAELRAVFLPKLFVGLFPFVALVLILIVGATVTQLVSSGVPDDITRIPWAFRSLAITLSIIFVKAVLIWILLSWLGRRQARRAYEPLREALSAARGAVDRQLAQFKAMQQARLSKAERTRNLEVLGVKQKYQPVMEKAGEVRDQALGVARSAYENKLNHAQQRRNRQREELDHWKQQKLAELQSRYEHESAALRQRQEKQSAESKKRYDDARATLERRWYDGLKQLQAPMGDVRSGNGEAPHRWDDPAWRTWRPPAAFPRDVRLGQMAVDLSRFTASASGEAPLRLKIPPAFAVPSTLAFPRQASLLIHTDREGRDEAIRILQMSMARLLTSLPAGRVRFNLFDPVGLGQSFAGFMHLADHDEALVGGRILTDQDQIDQRMRDLTEHMETVIQKYLRNEFATIDEYNAQAGELAEPYRFIVAADFPVGFSSEACRRLAAIASTGARCGVYVLIAHDTGHALPSGARLEDLEANALNLVREEGAFRWRDEVLGQFPMSVDEPPGEQELTQILHVVGRAAKEARRVEVAFETIAPTDQQMWSMDATDELRVPVGRMGATRLQELKLGKGVAQHVLIGGKTGSGKSTLLHVLATNLALWYSPEQVEFYLVDFKKGVEFKTYATNELPHARAIAVESDREFGLSVLQRLDAELARRGELYRKLGVQDLAAYRRERPKDGSYPSLPRTLLIIDEFQEFFSEDDKLAQDSSILIDRLVRQGRAFGIHVLLGSQTIAGAGLPRSTIGQMAVRVALQTSEADSQLILGDNNSAARLLTRPGEAIYNDQGGLVEGNSPFQVSWLADEKRDALLAKVRDKAAKAKIVTPPQIVFEGNVPAPISANRRLKTMLEAAPAAKAAGAPVAYLGEPVAIKEPTGVTLRRQSGANVILIGQQDEAAMALLESSAVSLAAQHPKDALSFRILDGTPADSPLVGRLAKLKEVLPHDVEMVEYRQTAEAIDALAKEVARRQAESSAAPTVLMMICGLQRYRVLRKQEDSFGFSGSGDADAPPATDKQFADILREGPGVGVHVIAWVDTPASLDRTLERSSLREFDNRVLFQMSANDSSNLIDTPAANKLGLNRAMLYSEEQGLLEKFRPYAVPGGEWLGWVREQLSGKGK